MAWKLEKLEKWPFGYRVTDSDTGETLLSEGMYAYASQDDSYEDALEARHHPRSERLAVAEANKAQLAKFELIIAAVNAYQTEGK